jgi:hypothetical protein
MDGIPPALRLPFIALAIALVVMAGAFGVALAVLVGGGDDPPLQAAATATRSPTVTRTASPTAALPPATTPSREAEVDATLVGIHEVLRVGSEVKRLTFALMLPVEPSATVAAAAQSLFDGLSDTCAPITAARWGGDLWPGEYSRVAKAIVPICRAVQDYNAERTTQAALRQVWRLYYDELDAALKAVPDRSEAQIRRAVVERE